jgi:hypothetical protein
LQWKKEKHRSNRDKKEALELFNILCVIGEIGKKRPEGENKSACSEKPVGGSARFYSQGGNREVEIECGGSDG